MKRENQNIYQLGCILNIFLNNCWNKEELKTLFRNTIQRRTTVKACVQSRFWAGSNGKQVQLIWTENELINRTLGLPGSPMIKTLCFHCRGCCFVVQSLNKESCPTLCNPMDCGPPDSSVHGISQARILVRLFPSPGHLSDPGVEPMSPASAAAFLSWVTKKAPTAGGLGSIPSQGTKILHAMQQGQKKKTRR